MLNLPTTTSELVVVAGAGATSLEVHASFDDLLQPRTVSQGAQNTPIAAPGTSTVVPGPAANTDRNVKFLSILNSGATCPVTVRKTRDGATFVDLFSVSLTASYLLQYDTDADGWRVYDNTGRILEGVL